ncbi:uncharacterized protein B0H64DRAFT_110503 [Chaetomium fimeti]|uniref:Zinc finger PHD-type domain-containing protein n=1 Tax=Chaetomium fimeti TaxID=1854472 RepID=A0AAE0HHU2_9PEZI|nr:hypothetical protein B0H64DRAFT_110503 [Chaetomium fimeti]
MPRCRRCKESAALDKPLFKCIHCGRCYHSACHRPHPQGLITNWVCKRCLAGQEGQVKRRRLYHDNSLLSSRAASPSSASSSLDSFRRTRMSPSTTAAINPSSSFTSHRSGDSTGPSIINCSFTGCPAKIDGSRQILCEAHLQVFSKSDKNGDSGQANGTHATQGPTGTSDSPFRPLSATNPRKLLPETDKDRPITMRKTAGNPPQLDAQQLRPKHSTPLSRGGSTSFPPSSRPLAPRPPANSPPASPGCLRDGESARKRHKLSPSPGHSPGSRVNGAVPLEPVRSPQSSRRASNLSPQAGRAREKEAKGWPKPSSRHPVRRVPVGLSSLRFIGGPEEPTPGVLSEQSSSGLNGSAGNVHRRSSGGSELSPDGETKDYFGRKRSSAASSTTLTESLDSFGQARRPSEPSNGKSNKTRPEEKGLDAQTPHGPFQANGIASSKPPARKMHVPIRPAPMPKTQPAQLPKPKKIDTARFDALIYSQPGASSPPPGIDLTPTNPPPPPPPLPQSQPQPSTKQPTTNTAPEPAPPETQPQDEPLYLAIDPRVHWPQAHSAAWHAAKRAEMRARGNRKANFGRAAQSLLRRRRRREAGEAGGQQQPFEESLPEKMAENPAWVRALRRLRGLPGAGGVGGGNGGGGVGGGSVSSGVEEEWAGGGGGGGGGGGYGSGVERRARRHGGGNGGGSGGGGVMGKRVGNSGVVVVTGLNGVHMESMKRFDESG